MTARPRVKSVALVDSVAGAVESIDGWREVSLASVESKQPRPGVPRGTNG